MFGFFKKPLKFDSKINGEITIKKRYGQNSVLTGNITQSGGELVRMWEQILSNEQQGRNIMSVLLLGVAGGMILRLSHKYFPKAILTGVEIDPVMVKIAKEQFDLRDGLKAEIYQEDAVRWIRKEKKKYDLVVVDLFIKEKNAPVTRDKSFLLQLKRILSPHGIVFYNSQFSINDQKESDDFHLLLQSIFSRVDEVYSYPLNKVFRLQV